MLAKRVINPEDNCVQIKNIPFLLVFIVVDLVPLYAGSFPPVLSPPRQIISVKEVHKSISVGFKIKVKVEFKI